MKPICSPLVLAAVLSLVAGCARLADRSPGTPPPVSPATMNSDTVPDPYVWLEEVTGEKALDWVREQNALSNRELTNSPLFEPTRLRLLEILDSKDRIPMVTKHGRFLYNFWRDRDHVRGLYRRTTMEEYRKPNPDWEMVLDLDELAAAEKENWVWKGAEILEPDYDLALVHLSRGGADAGVVREFDLRSKEFVPSGFKLSEAKSAITWRDRQTVYVGTDFGPASLTKSGYPRVVKEWKRGTSLSGAPTVLEGKE